MHQRAPHRYYRFGPNVLDCLRGVLWQDGTQVPLTPRVFDILTTLVQHHGKLVTKDDFMRLVWGGTAVEDNNLARQVSTLRKVLHERPGQRDYIATVTGVGYRFVGTVTELDELPDELLSLIGHAPAPGLTVTSPVVETAPTAGDREPPAPPPAPAAVVASRAAATPSRSNHWGVVLLGAVAMAAVVALFVGPDQPTNAAQVSRTLWQFTHGSGSQSEPAWSPDGSRLALTSDRNGNADIWVHDLNDSGTVQLTTSNAHDWQPHWSPDGQSIVYRSERSGGGLYVIPASGGPERRLTSFGARPRWSPSGDTILFTQNAPDSSRAIKLFVVDAAGGTPRRVNHPALAGTQITSAAWAPDGRVSLWTRDEVGGRQFLTIPLDGGPATQSTIPSEIALPAQGAAGPTLTSFAWAPSGRFIYFEGRSQAVWNVWRVEVEPETLNWVGAPERLTVGPGADRGLAVSPDGSRLAFGVNTARPGVWSFEFDPSAGRMAAAGERIISGESGERGADASSDGSRIVYRLERNNRHELWERAGDAAPRLLVSENGWTLSPPRWSPDNTRLAYQRTHVGPSGQVDGRTVTVMDVTTTPGRKQHLVDLAPGEEAVPTDWTADGQTLLAACRLEGFETIGTCVLPTQPQDSSTGTRAIARLSHDPRANLFQQRYSPNQRWISFVAVPRADRSTTTVFVMPASGGPWLPITDGQSYEDKSRWSPDGRVLYYISNRDGRFEVWGRRFDPEGGRPEGQPFRVTSLEGARQVLSPYLTDMEMFITADRIFLPMFEASGRVWMLDQADR